MRPLLCVLGLLAMMLATPVPGHAKLRLVADNWPPFTDASMPGGGLATSIVTTALTRAGYASAVEEAPWARALLGISEGRYDVLINAWQSDSRARIGQFSSAYLTNRIRLLQRTGDEFRYQRQSDLYPYSIAVVRDYAYSPEFDGDTRLNKVAVRNFSSAVRMLAAGRVNLAVEDEYVARYNLQREPQEVRDGVMLVEPPLGENTLHILVSLKHPEHARIVERFERAVVAMKADGSYARLLREHGFLSLLPEPARSRVNPRTGRHRPHKSQAGAPSLIKCAAKVRNGANCRQINANCVCTSRWCSSSSSGICSRALASASSSSL